MNASPLQEIFPPVATAIRLFVKRDDLLHPYIQGNKWRKLAPFLDKINTQKAGVLSFGGAFSNHLHALASAGKIYGFPTIGIVRGLAADLENATLAHARQCGMKVFPVTKVAYEALKAADLPEVFRHIGFNPAEPYYLLPEGGDTPEALVGCAAIPVEIMHQLPADAGARHYFCIPAGTGCTAAGVIAGMTSGCKTLVFPAAPYGVDRESIGLKLQRAGYAQDANFDIVQNIKPAKFAQMTAELRVFIHDFQENTTILLDPIYTSKMMFKLYELLSQQFFPPGSCVVALHTGGLQGWEGMPLETKLSL